jgi:hypothetical protein
VGLTQSGKVPVSIMGKAGSDRHGPHFRPHDALQKRTARWLVRF